MASTNPSINTDNVLPIKPSSLPPGWIEGIAGDYGIYYFHEESGTIQWGKPCLIDSTGMAGEYKGYYYDREDGKTQWEVPSSVTPRALKNRVATSLKVNEETITAPTAKDNAAPPTPPVTTDSPSLPTTTPTNLTTSSAEPIPPTRSSPPVDPTLYPNPHLQHQPSQPTNAKTAATPPLRPTLLHRLQLHSQRLPTRHLSRLQLAIKNGLRFLSEMYGENEERDLCAYE